MAIKITFVCFLFFNVFAEDIRQLKATGIPVVVKAMHIIKKLNAIWYIPSPHSPITFDKKILYINPKPLTIILEADKINVANKRFGIFLKKITSHDYIYSEEV